jgi:pilus assembly protein Flp/PilA
MTRALVERLTRRQRDDGASAVEYGLLIAGIAALIVVIVFALGSQIGTLFGNSCGTIRSAIEHNSCGP